jgi:hypothetical protein
MLAGGAAIGAGVLSGSTKAFGEGDRGGFLTRGDIAILRFVAAAELLETDLWIQYAKLGGLTPGQAPVEVTPSFTGATGRYFPDPWPLSWNRSYEVQHTRWV